MPHADRSNAGRCRQDYLGSWRKDVVTEAIMKICLFASVAVVGLFSSFACSASPTEQPAQAPLELDVTQNAPEFDVGSDVAFTVSLKGERGQPTAATADTPVTLSSPAVGSMKTVIPQGSTSAVIHWRPDKPGVFQVQATAAEMAPKAVLVPVKSPATSSPSEAAPVPTAPSPAPSPPTDRLRPTAKRGGVVARDLKIGENVNARANAARPPSVIGDLPVLKLYVEPEPIEEMNRTWSADVSFMLQTAAGALMPAKEDLSIDLTTRFAHVSPRQVTVPAGKGTSRATPIRLVADGPGEDEIQGVSAIGRVSQVVHFRSPAPTTVAVTVSPIQVISDGRSVVLVSVRLIDDTKRLRAADFDTDVELASTNGILKESSLTIPKGGSAATTTIVSMSRGPATITADAAGLDEGSATVLFVLPLYLIVFSTVGGVLGAFVRSDKSSKSGRRVFENLAIGAVMGVVFWAILFFGALKAVAALPFNPTDVPAGNELGSALLGFAGGWLGRSFLGRPGKRRP